MRVPARPGCTKALAPLLAAACLMLAGAGGPVFARVAPPIPEQRQRPLVAVYQWALPPVPEGEQSLQSFATSIVQYLLTRAAGNALGLAGLETSLDLTPGGVGRLRQAAGIHVVEGTVRSLQRVDLVPADLVTSSLRGQGGQGRELAPTEAGRLLGADYVITGGVSSFKVDWWPSRGAVQASAFLNFRIHDVGAGRVVGDYQGRLDASRSLQVAEDGELRIALDVMSALTDTVDSLSRELIDQVERTVQRVFRLVSSVQWVEGRDAGLADGTDLGVRRGDYFELQRGGRRIALLRVLAADGAESYARIIQGRGRVTAGDTVYEAPSNSRLPGWGMEVSLPFVPYTATSSGAGQETGQAVGLAFRGLFISPQSGLGGQLGFGFASGQITAPTGPPESNRLNLSFFELGPAWRAWDGDGQHLDLGASLTWTSHRVIVSSDTGPGGEQITAARSRRQYALWASYTRMWLPALWLQARAGYRLEGGQPGPWRYTYEDASGQDVPYTGFLDQGAYDSLDIDDSGLYFEAGVRFNF